MGLSKLQSVCLMRRGGNIEKENDSLVQKNRFLKKGLVGLAILSVFSIGSCCKNANGLEKTNQENAQLNLRLDRYQKEVQKLSSENVELGRYANEAENFSNSICEPSPDLVDCRTAKEEKSAAIQYKKELKAYDDACKVLGIDQEKLSRLQKGWQAQK